MNASNLIDECQSLSQQYFRYYIAHGYRNIRNEKIIKVARVVNIKLSFTG